jgi:hypothetical protein
MLALVYDSQYNQNFTGIKQTCEYGNEWNYIKLMKIVNRVI